MRSHEQPILIKRYAGRRLYNVEDAVYLSMSDVAVMAAEGEAFVVCEASTGEDVTSSILALISSPITEH